MSQENVEIVRSMYRPGDPSQFFELLHEGVQVDVSKLPFERRRWAVLYTLRDAKIVRIEHFSERHEALEAAGLSE